MLSSFKTKHEAENYHLLADSISPGIAEFYKDACTLMNPSMSMNPASPQGVGRPITPLSEISIAKLTCTSHLVAHLLREVESAIRSSLLPPLEVDSFSEVCIQTTVRINSYSYSVDSDFRGNSRSEQVNRILGSLESENREIISEAWLKHGPSGLHKYAHRPNLDHPRKVDNDFQEKWTQYNHWLNLLLLAIKDNYATVYKKIDDILSSPSPKTALGEFKKHVPNTPKTIRYLFKKLDNPTWIASLRKAGYFDDSPEPIYFEDGSIHYPWWFQHDYLLRMAMSGHSCSNEIWEVMHEIRNANNPRVHEALTKVACYLKPDHARRWAEKEISWLLQLSDIELYSKDYSNLIEFLIRNNMLKDALNLLAALLKIFKNERILPIDENSKYTRIETGTLIQRYDYNKLLETHVPELLVKDSQTVLSFLCDRLEEAIVIETTSETPIDDHSSIWLPVLELSEKRSMPHTVKECLAISVIRSVQKLVKSKHSRKDAFKLLSAKQLPVFKRIDLFFRNGTRYKPDSTLSLILELDNSSYNSCILEIYQFLKDKFETLPAESKETFFERIRKGPDDKDLPRDYHSFSSDDQDFVKAVWFLKRLGPIRNHLPADLKQVFDSWEEKYPGQTEQYFTHRGKLQTFNIRNNTDIINFDQMSIAEILDEIVRFKPDENTYDWIADKVYLSLLKAVAADPAKFSGSAHRFIDLFPPCIRGLIEGFSNLVREGTAFEWNRLLELALWVVQQPKDIQINKGQYKDLDPGWGWTRNRIANLIYEGLHDGQAQIPIQYRDTTWKILHVLAQDPDPNPEDDNIDTDNFYDKAVNSVRGRALEAVVLYAFWVKKNENITKPGFKSIPEVRKCLNQNLSQSKHSSLAISAIFGWAFPYLSSIAPNWAKRHADDIFPEPPDKHNIWKAAWKAYLSYNVANRKCFQIIRDKYSYALDLMKAKNPVDEQGLNRTDLHLGYHIYQLYLAEVIQLGSHSNFLTRHFSLAPAKLRTRLLEDIGTSISSPIGSTESRLLMDLWEFRLAEAKSSSDYEELKAFGFWFTQDTLNPQWALEQLHSVLTLGVNIDNKSNVANHLANAVKLNPFQGIQCFASLIENASPDWAIFWKDDVEQGLRLALSEGNEEAHNEAKKLINHLALYGHQEFRELLENW